jgi:hypothetical protein
VNICATCDHWSAAWKDDRGEWHTYGQSVLADSSVVLHGVCDFDGSTRLETDTCDEWIDAELPGQLELPMGAE